MLVISLSQSSEEAAIIDDLQSISESESQKASAAFWSTMLKHDTESLGYQIPKRRTPIELVSACTGSFAEGAALKDRISDRVVNRDWRL